MEIIPIKMALAIFFCLCAGTSRAASAPGTEVSGFPQCGYDNGYSVAASYRPPLLSLRCFAAGRFIWTYPFRGRGAGRATHRATSTHLTGSISKQRMPEQKNHTPNHPQGAHVTDTPTSSRRTPQIAIFSLPTL